MKNWKVKFSSQTVSFFLEGKFAAIDNMVDKSNAFYITDENVYALHQKKFKGKKTIVIPAGEEHKQQATVDFIIEALVNLGATRQAILIGVGGGVVTDMVGYVAGVYMRGVAVGFVPTTILAMVDASIGGKNGIDLGIYKNMVGLIRQPSFLLYDTDFLKTLPKHQWENGFAEIIKHACIKDAAMFELLEKNTISSFKNNPTLLADLIQRNALIKTKVVLNDEFEQGNRKLLNYGHTLGHAIENMYELSHGQAISIGMTYAALMSAQIKGFKDAEKVIALLAKYGLPTFADFDKKKAFKTLQMDKKKNAQSIHYILLQKIGKGVIQSLTFTELDAILKQY